VSPNDSEVPSAASSSTPAGRRTEPSDAPASSPQLTLVMPALNEEEAIGATVRGLLDAFAAAAIGLELIVVDNGSSDRTGAIVAELSRHDPRLRLLRRESGHGYGGGILAGLAQARGAWVGWINADGQLAPTDIVRLAGMALRERSPALVKVRRVSRADGFERVVVTLGWNLLCNLLFPSLRSTDVNGSPKLVPRDWLADHPLRSQDWFIDPELLLAARRSGLRVVELAVAGLARGGGRSHVKLATLTEFFCNLMRERLRRHGRGG
jgi:glycosyltransferase involved in cell wall biosynthesis